MVIDRHAPLQFLRTAYQPDDWVAVFLRSYQSGRVAQRIAPLAVVSSPSFQNWLIRENEGGVNVYIGVNAIRPRMVSRRRTAIGPIRHVFLDADEDGQALLAAITHRRDVPPPSYVVHTSPNHIHVLWRVSEFTIDGVEQLQKSLARELNTDLAATSCSQTTRLPGFVNYKRKTLWTVVVEFRGVREIYAPSDFPMSSVHVRCKHLDAMAAHPRSSDAAVLDRARRYLAMVPPAITGQHGDVHTFRVCCRLVRGFALSDGDALQLLSEWNTGCQPPWSERELIDKLRRARRYGREPVGGLVGDGA